MNHYSTVKISLPLKKTFTVSKGSTTVKTNLLTILNNRYPGEASASVHYGPSINELELDIKAGIERLKKIDHITIDTLEEINNYEIHAVARSALIGMVLNYLSGELDKYPWEVLSLGTPVGIKSSFTIGIDDPSEVAKAIKESDYPILKIKMGSDTDRELIDAIKDIKGKEIRVDANGGWNLETAEEMIFYLAKAGITLIEQPTDIEHIKEWPQLKKDHEDVMLVIDEGIGTVDDYHKFSEWIDGVNIKMEKSGGILEAIKIAREAKEEKKKVMLGCMVESSVGIAQSVYMSSLADYCDLDAPQLLKDDIAKGIKYNRETIEVDREIIGGPKLIRDAVEKYSNE